MIKILDELKDLKETSKQNDDEIKRLNTMVNNQSKIIECQQRFLESIDYDRRCCDLIVLGLDETRASDKDQFTRILRVIDVKPEDVKVHNIERLGKIDEDDGNNRPRRRPIKVTVDSRAVRNSILKNASKLKDQDDDSPFKRVYLKADVHPEIRKEEKRLYEIFKAEKLKPENADVDVLFDRKKRVVTVNGDEVDSFKLFSSSFR